MNKAFLAIGFCLVLSGVAFSQEKSAKEQIVGAWMLVSVTIEMDDGKKGEPFGPSPKGMIIFSSDAHFSLFQSRTEIPKIAANDRDDLPAEFVDQFLHDPAAISDWRRETKPAGLRHR